MRSMACCTRHPALSVQGKLVCWDAYRSRRHRIGGMVTGRPDLEARINYGNVVAGEAHVPAAGLALEDRFHEIFSRIVSH